MCMACGPPLNKVTSCFSRSNRRVETPKSTWSGERKTPLDAASTCTGTRNSTVPLPAPSPPPPPPLPSSSARRRVMRMVPSNRPGRGVRSFTTRMVRDAPPGSSHADRGKVRFAGLAPEPAPAADSVTAVAAPAPDAFNPLAFAAAWTPAATPFSLVCVMFSEPSNDSALSTSSPRVCPFILEPSTAGDFFALPPVFPVARSCKAGAGAGASLSLLGGARLMKRSLDIASITLSGTPCGLWSSRRQMYGTPDGTCAPMSGCTWYGELTPNPLEEMMKDPLDVSSMKVPAVCPRDRGKYVTDRLSRDSGGTSTEMNSAGWNGTLSVVRDMSVRGSLAWVLKTAMEAVCRPHRGFLPKSTSGG
mmetsp:Transcript_29868/g.74749  ORF Transcript_29868/g.74749 Transcript_29868/m.74749 type:complete len:361 (+) Transcript_29868:2041-3123(+)